MRKIEDLFKDNSSSTLHQSSSVQDNRVTFKGTVDVFSLGFFSKSVIFDSQRYP